MRTHCQTIDTRWGSDNHPHYSHGNTLPYTGVPFGMNYFLPQTTHEQEKLQVPTSSVAKAVIR